MKAPLIIIFVLLIFYICKTKKLNSKKNPKISKI